MAHDPRSAGICTHDRKPILWTGAHARGAPQPTPRGSGVPFSEPQRFGQKNILFHVPARLTQCVTQRNVHWSEERAKRNIGREVQREQRLVAMIEALAQESRSVCLQLTNERAFVQFWKTLDSEQPVADGIVSLSFHFSRNRNVTK